MGEIPQYIEDANLYLDIYRQEMEYGLHSVLKDRATRLYVAILMLMGKWLVWLRDSRFSKFC